MCVSAFFVLLIKKFLWISYQDLGRASHVIAQRAFRKAAMPNTHNPNIKKEKRYERQNF